MSISRKARTGVAAAAAATVAAALGMAAPAAAVDDEPKNMIVFIADGMGYNHLDLASLYQHGTSNWQVDVDPATGEIEHQDGYGQTPAQVYENYDVQVGLSHWSLNTYESNGVGYDGEQAWGDFDWVRPSPTDSAAAGTSMATGVKTLNGYLGVDADQNPVMNMAEYAQATGRSAGVVSDVPFAHATPASWGAHVASRGANHEIAEQMVYGDLDVVIGAGHPLFDDNAEPRDADWVWLTEGQYADLQDGNTGFDFAETSEGIQAVASGQELPERFFGLAPAAETLQFNRSSLADVEARRGAGREDGLPLTEDQIVLPYEAERNDIVSLSEMTEAALNVLGQNEDGFFTMVEAGAVDWAGHANATTGTIEDMIGFNEAVETAHQWVEENSSWDETLIIVTADHETGYLDGAHGDPVWTSITGEEGEIPVDGWYSGSHTNHLVPLFAHGAGAEHIYDYVRGEDPVRGAYIDNIDVAQLGFDLWAEEPVSFSDVPQDHEFAAEISWLAEQGITTGWADGTFRPGGTVTREAMAAFLYRYSGSPEHNAPAVSPFSDVATSEGFYPEVTWLAETGIANGYQDGTFRLRQGISREAMAAFMYRLAGSPEVELPAESPFADVPATEGFYTEIVWMYQAGIASGWETPAPGGVSAQNHDPRPEFRPRAPIQRQAMAAFLHRYDELTN